VRLGAGGTAWLTQARPFAADEVCWGALSRDDLSPTFREPEDVKAVETPVLEGDLPLDGPRGSCQLTSSDGDEWALTVRVHRLTDEAGDDGNWADEFLAARLTPLGGGLLGMASDDRAWLAIPEGFLGRPGDFEGRYAPAEEPDALCGIKGLTSGRKRAPHRPPVITEGHGPVRTCDRDLVGSRPGQRLMTVEDLRLAGIFTRMTPYRGDPVRSAAGSGGLGPDLGALRARCQAGEKVCLVQNNGRGAEADVRSLFRQYVEAEAARLGCAPLKLRLPRPGGSR
jgi:hypothetical protein